MGAHWSARKMRLLNSPAEKPPSRMHSLVVRIAKSIRRNWQLLAGFACLALGYAREFWGSGPLSRWSVFFIVFYTVVLCVGLSALVTVKLIAYTLRRLYAPEEEKPPTPEN